MLAFARPKDKCVDIELGIANNSQRHPIPAVTIVPDFYDSPYGHTLCYVVTRVGGGRDRRIMLCSRGVLTVWSQCESRSAF